MRELKKGQHPYVETVRFLNSVIIITIIVIGLKGHFQVLDDMMA
jgi:hypothetical protein